MHDTENSDYICNRNCKTIYVSLAPCTNWVRLVRSLLFSCFYLVIVFHFAPNFQTDLGFFFCFLVNESFRIKHLGKRHISSTSLFDCMHFSGICTLVKILYRDPALVLLPRPARQPPSQTVTAFMEFPGRGERQGTQLCWLEKGRTSTADARGNRVRQPARCVRHVY